MSIHHDPALDTAIRPGITVIRSGITVVQSGITVIRDWTAVIPGGFSVISAVAELPVLREIQQRSDEASRKLSEARRAWLKGRAVTDRALIEVLLADLDEGEAEVIALALELEADRVLMDDLDGRRLARRIGLTPVGTLGLLLAARQEGKIPSLRAEIEKLLESGFRAHEDLVAKVLREAGEE